MDFVSVVQLPAALTSGGFIQVSFITRFYEIGVPNAVIATGSNWAVMQLQAHPTKNFSVEFLTNSNLSPLLPRAGSSWSRRTPANGGFTFVMILRRARQNGADGYGEAIYEGCRRSDLHECRQ